MGPLAAVLVRHKAEFSFTLHEKLNSVWCCRRGWTIPCAGLPTWKSCAHEWLLLLDWCGSHWRDSPEQSQVLWSHLQPLSHICSHLLWGCSGEGEKFAAGGVCAHLRSPFKPCQCCTIVIWLKPNVLFSSSRILLNLEPACSCLKVLWMLLES